MTKKSEEGRRVANPSGEPATDPGWAIAHRQRREKLMDRHRQDPILSKVEGDDENSVAWDARLEAHLSAFILQHLATDPPPPGARLAGDVRRWAENLQHDAQARQGALARPALLRAV
jgi:hypothetical protein